MACWVGEGGGFLTRSDVREAGRNDQLDAVQRFRGSRGACVFGCMGLMLLVVLAALTVFMVFTILAVLLDQTQWLVEDSAG